MSINPEGTPFRQRREAERNAVNRSVTSDGVFNTQTPGNLANDPALTPAPPALPARASRSRRLWRRMSAKSKAMVCSAAAMLSARYIADRFMPDKAIDLIDEASSKLRIEINSLPENLEILDPARSMIYAVVSSRVSMKGMELEEVGAEEEAGEEEGRLSRDEPGSLGDGANRRAFRHREHGAHISPRRVCRPAA